MILRVLGCVYLHSSLELPKLGTVRRARRDRRPPASLPQAIPSESRVSPIGKTTHAKVVIIGSGPAGYTAAIYAARAMLEPVLIQGIQPGGQLTITTDVENYPGFADVIQGPWLMEQMEKQARACRHQDGHRSRHQGRPRRQRPFRLECDSGDVYLADALIIATGAQARWLDLPASRSSRASASRPAPPATASSIATRK